MIILTYNDLSEEEAKHYHPKLVYVDEQNRITHTKGVIAEAEKVLREI